MIPLLEEINPDLRSAAMRLSSSMKELCAFAESEADAKETNKVSELKDLPDAIFNIVVGNLIKKADTDASLEAVHVASLHSLCEKGKDGSSVSLPFCIRARIDGEKLIFEPDTGREEKADESFETELASGQNLLPSGDIITVAENPPHLIARSRREGDKILSGGMHKSVKKLMCDKKIPISKRNSLPVICDDEGILWIPGVALRDGAKNKKENTILSYKDCEEVQYD